MQIILTKSVRKLGKVGDTVTVAAGYGRNYLLPQNLAIRATKLNLEKFSLMQKDLEVQNQDNISEANKSILSLKNQNVVFAVQSSTDGRLFGSIGAKNIAKELSSITGLDFKYQNILLTETIKFNGVYEVKVSLHPEVSSTILVIVAKTEEEAKAALLYYTEEKESKTEEQPLAN